MTLRSIKKQLRFHWITNKNLRLFKRNFQNPSYWTYFYTDKMRLELFFIQVSTDLIKMVPVPNDSMLKSKWRCGYSFLWFSSKLGGLMEWMWTALKLYDRTSQSSRSFESFWPSFWCFWDRLFQCLKTVQFRFFGPLSLCLSNHPLSPTIHF